MTAAKPGMGRGIARTLGQANAKVKGKGKGKVHIQLQGYSVSTPAYPHSHAHLHGHAGTSTNAHSLAGPALPLPLTLQPVHHAGRVASGWNSGANGSNGVNGNVNAVASSSSGGYYPYFDSSYTLPTSASSSSASSSSTTITAPFFPSGSRSGIVNASVPSYLALVPQWDVSPALVEHLNLTATPSQSLPPSTKDIIEPYRPARHPPSPQFRKNPFAPIPPIIRELHPRTVARAYSTASVPRYEAMHDPHSSSFYHPPSGPSIPPFLLGSPDKIDIAHLDFSNLVLHDFPLPLPSGASSLAELPARDGPSPGPGSHSSPSSVKSPRVPEQHTVLSPSPPAINNLSGSSSALPAAQALSLPEAQANAILPNPPEKGAPTSLYSSSLQFRIGASGLAKHRSAHPPPRTSGRSRPPTPPRQRTFPLPEVDAPSTFKSIKVGEDAYFTRLDSMCVADGVGGWARSGRDGADAARWSMLLTHFCEAEVGKWWDGAEEYIERYEKTTSSKVGGSWVKQKWQEDMDTSGLEQGWRRKELDPIEIMQKGFEKCLACALAEGITGSSTCLLALLHHSTLHLANLGDCALLVIRKGEVIFRTTEMTHAFNHPMQLGPHSRDEPMKDAKQWKVEVEQEDVVVMGSDGLVDNLFDEEILGILATFAPPSTSTSPNGQQQNQLPTPPSSRPTTPSSTARLPPFDPQKVSDALCTKARSISEQTSASTPFMHRCFEEGIDFVGGKKDDITVIVGVVGERQSKEGMRMELRT